MAASDTREGKFRRGLGGVAIGSAIGAFFVSPLLPLANPAMLAVGGILCGVSVFALYQMAVYPVTEARSRRLVFATAPIGLALLMFALFGAAWADFQRHDVCASLQREMLTGRAKGAAAPPPGRSEAKDAFQALGCRPYAGLPW